MLCAAYNFVDATMTARRTSTKRKLARMLAATLPRRLLTDPDVFDIWQEHGSHVVPVSYYGPIPDTRQLSSHSWDVPSAMIGVDMREAEQLELLGAVARDFRAEYELLPSQGNPADGFYLANPFFSSVDAEMAYCMLRRFQPQRVYEIGSGFSTLLSALALTQNRHEGFESELRGFDPFPAAYLRNPIEGVTEIVQTQLQDIPLETFDALGDGDVLFIDSTHVLSTGSDVRYAFLEVLPRLNPGVVVHIHDIFLPYDYPSDWIHEKRRFWTEQYLLHAFLLFNERFSILWMGSLMAQRYPGELSRTIPSFVPGTRPGSFWMRRTDGGPVGHGHP